MPRGPLTIAQMETFITHLRLEERSFNTVSKYARDIKGFYQFLPPPRQLSKEGVIAYKQHLVEKGYKSTSINSMLVAVNGMLSFLGRPDCRVKLLKTQRQVFRDRGRELTQGEYKRLLEAADSKKQPRTRMMLQAICGTGIRVSELPYLTVEAAKAGVASITCKGKSRQVAIPHKLRRSLLAYCREQGIASGPIFVTRTGKAMHRSSVWRAMKALCAAARIERGRVFPHNLRHLFATTYYAKNPGDVMGLAAVLGHSSVETTRIYTSASRTSFDQKLDRLGLVF